ncbi:hypothetical protein IWQ62_001664 [Dispira parvispora]|uniref:Uncharacterized protein n=1 Tax=Dispira parvispora TaxID=1520584 RepID=A0A9W8ART7_9FUNG|nr:hypothetical protein IWQ62_001664 [Dispira parvispora]
MTTDNVLNPSVEENKALVEAWQVVTQALPWVLTDNETQRAQAAGTNRLLSCLVNEHMVQAFLVHNSTSVHQQGSCRYLLAVCPLESTDRTASGDLPLPGASRLWTHMPVLLLGLKHQPICHPTDYHPPYLSASTLTSVGLLDPEECEAPIYLLPSLTQPSQGQVIIDPTDLFRLVATWNGYDATLTDELCKELSSSVEHLAYAYAHPPTDPSLASSELEWEHAIVEGHATHPMHKARYSLPPLAPVEVGEDLRNVNLCLLAVPRQTLVIRGPFEEELRPLLEAAGLTEIDKQGDEVIVPVHPRQLPNILARFPHVRSVVAGCIPAVSQASVRTVVPVKTPSLVLKLPLGLKISSALRTITPWTTYLGPGLRPVIDRLKLDRQACVVVHETSSVVAVHDDTDVAKHLSCLIRENATELVHSSQEKVVVCAALTERSSSGQCLPHVVQVWGLKTEDQRLDFLTQYATLLLRAFLPPIIHNGFTFEAHQQNVMMRYNAYTGQIKGFMVRDFGGIKVHQTTLQRTTGLLMEAIPDGCAEAHDMLEVYTLAYHTLVQMNLHRLIRALDLHYNGKGWVLVNRLMHDMIPKDSDLYQLWLVETRVHYKCFMTMKLDGLYRDYLYVDVPNLLTYTGESN